MEKRYLTEDQLLWIARQQTNPRAVEIYGDTFLRIARAVQEKVLSLKCEESLCEWPTCECVLDLDRCIESIKQADGYKGWICVKDDLPDPESMDYVWSSWVSEHDGKQTQYQGRSRYWAAKGWRHEGWAEWHQDVTHWMPMPSMPKI